jgi:hypothetical protein
MSARISLSGLLLIRKNSPDHSGIRELAFPLAAAGHTLRWFCQMKAASHVLLAF